MILFTALTTLLVTLLLAINNYKINKNSLYLAGFLISLSIGVLLHYFAVQANSPFALAIAYGHFMPIYYLTGPLLFFYIRGTLTDSARLKPWDWLHFMPFIIGLISIFPYYFESFDTKLDIATKIIHDTNHHKKVNISWLYPNIYNLAVRPFILFGYFIACIFKLYTYNRSKKKSVRTNSHKKIVHKWLYLITSITGVCALSYGILTFNFLITDSVSKETINGFAMNYYSGISFSLIPFLLLIFPEVLYGLPSTKNNLISTETETYDEINKTDETSNYSNDIELEDSEFTIIATNILDYLAKEKPFTDTDFSLDDLSKSLNIPKHHLYYCFNTVLKTKFTTIRAILRVEYAKECLLNGDLKNLSMEGVWTKSGFSSKTSFFVSFKEVTGLTPLEFIKINNLN
ncbi:helix-turn-helix domain-containing protein [Flavobacterium sp. 20NA77.7]|uniref:Helix-turn-helix domain-containing protein n=1 Tax=Flavobacterium nakdongensis TaxID=3073563 RepID=A0ABY9R7T4_9FLAO|nr:helix-turn-helix domain-containing protein [Flavobacterium sp. 20NA77.7]WMW77331.1 helix-turn-helix domain-containing protein [Flavobacterium sp. 20NA77.7]